MDTIKRDINFFLLSFVIGNNTAASRVKSDNNGFPRLYRRLRQH